MVKDKVDEAIETLVDNEPRDVSYNELLQCLCELTDKDFKNLIKIAKLERKTNKLIAQYLQQQYPDVIYRFDLASDLKLTPGQASKHKKLHPERGYPDLFIAESSENVNSKDWNGVVREWGFYFGLYIEIKKDGTKLKRDKDAKKPLKGETKIRKKGDWFDKHIEEQAEMLEKLRARGYKAEFGVGLEECKKIIDEYLRS